ncbi:HET-domain-containing protein [Paramyrothecium foliicola]|nr:HET-domain-containing protein [Paramyrothecium foliicola]
MRLINTITFQLTGPFIGGDVPPYAILSHTWNGNEPSLQAMADCLRRKDDERFLKIRSCCAQALKDGYIFLWVDTVCIDKTSSAELSEAINSMYDWYSSAGVCYAYLEDFSLRKESTLLTSELAKCRWFTRGWTLQELIAPVKMVFFNQDWIEIGDRKQLAHTIKSITGIEPHVLYGKSIHLFSVAERMSWASRRNTTRAEDQAYCLLGIFGINMPMLYGEGGPKAFFRLQQEILRASNDQSIFAWSPSESRSTLHGLLAPSPSFFRDSNHFKPTRAPGDTNDLTITNRGISLDVLVNPTRSSIVLKCRRAGSPVPCSVRVQRLRSGPNHYAIAGYISETEQLRYSADLERINIFVPHEISEVEFYHRNLVDYLALARLPTIESDYYLDGYFPGDQYDSRSATLSISPYADRGSGAIFSFHHREESSLPFLVALFCDGGNLENEGLRPETDVIGVFDNVDYKNPVDYYFEDFQPWFTTRGNSDAPITARKTSRNGVDAWTLKDGTLVHVSVTRNLNPHLQYIGCARILAGKSWELDILPFLDWGSFTDYVD